MTVYTRILEELSLEAAEGHSLNPTPLPPFVSAPGRRSAAAAGLFPPASAQAASVSRPPGTGAAARVEGGRPRRPGFVSPGVLLPPASDSRRAAAVNLVVEIVRRARPALRAMTGGRAGTCIFCTRVACGVFSRLGIVNRPLAVELTAYNPAMTRLVLDGDAGAVGDSAPDEKRVCYYIGTHVPDAADVIRPDLGGRRGWDGHLVCLVEDRLILDMTLDQVSRPQYGIRFDTAVLEPPADVMRRFLDGQGLEGVAEGCLVRYRRTNDRAYETAGDWDRAHTRDAVLAIAEAVEASLRAGLMPTFHTGPLDAAGVTR